MALLVFEGLLSRPGPVSVGDSDCHRGAAAHLTVLSASGQQENFVIGFIEYNIMSYSTFDTFLNVHIERLQTLTIRIFL